MRLLWETELDLSWNFPSDWVEQVLEISSDHGTDVFLDGLHPTSRETADFSGSTLTVTNGSDIAANLPWLFEAYQSRFLNLARDLSGYDLEASKDQSSAVNINHITGRGNKYERHVDSNPLTGLLFVNSVPIGEGGELTFDFFDGPFDVQPVSGKLLFFDAREVPHYVKELKSEGDRVSVPMNYYFSGTTEQEIQEVVPKEYAMGIKK